jgi:hypothetical protein
MTRHPWKGAAEQLRVRVRELVETRAAKEKNPAIGLLCSNREVTAGELAEKKQQRQNLPFFPPGV